MPRRDYLDKVRTAFRAVDVAENHFNHAVGLYIDSAILECRYAEKRLSAALTDVRPLFCPDGLDRQTNRGKEC